MTTMTAPDGPRLPHAEQQPTLTVPEAGGFLGLGKASAYEAASRGDIPTIRIGRRLLVPTAALRRMLALNLDHESEHVY